MSEKKYKIPNQKHYAPVSSDFMENENLTPEAKAIYVYLWTHAGILGHITMPAEIMIKHLHMSRGRFYNHLKELTDQGYLTVTKVKSTSTGRYYNLYHLHDEFNAYNYDYGKTNEKKPKLNDARKKKYAEEHFHYEPSNDPELDSLFS